MPRAEYEARAQQRRAEAPRLCSEGLTRRQIAEWMGISESRVKQLFREGRS